MGLRGRVERDIYPARPAAPALGPRAVPAQQYLAFGLRNSRVIFIVNKVADFHQTGTIYVTVFG